MIVVAVASGALLFNAFQIQEHLSIMGEVKANKFWISVTCLVFGGLQIVGIAMATASWTWRHGTRVFGNIRARKIELSDGAGWVLVLMAVRQPDSTRLLTQHTCVRELRLHRLIETSSYSFAGGEFEAFGLTERGLAAANPRLDKFPRYLDPKVKDLISMVTGVEDQAYDAVTSRNKP
jgi:hypothetical protein